MKQEITLESLYDLLFWFIQKQEIFNSKQEIFNSKQEIFNSKQEVYNTKTDANFASIREDLAEFRREEKWNHNLSHRMIMQAFEGISDLRADIDTDREPWKKPIKK